MTPFESPLFFLLAGIILGGAVVLGVAERPLRWWRLGSSVVMVGAYCLWNPVEGVWLGSTIAWFVLVSQGHLIAHRRGAPAWERALAVVLGLAPLIAVKVGSAMGWQSLGFLGISYITFRLVQIVLETSDGLIKTLPLAEQLSFLLFWPAISSGPIDRSRRFAIDSATLWSRAQYLELVKVGLSRVVVGVGYKFVGAALASVLLTSVPPGPSVAAMYLYGLQLFFDFAGYSLMAVGASMILGIRTPMNFRLPFVAESIRDFWSRWHITLSFWLRDYLYTRLLGALIRRKVSVNVANRVSLGVNMLAMGFWHGISPSYIAYGAYHGGLMILNDVYEKQVPFHAKFQRATWYRVASIAVTTHLVLFGFLLFSGRILGS